MTDTFATRVHAVVSALEPGELVTYGDVAAQAGRPGAARAVGRLMAGSEGLPWWRVIAANGRLVPGLEQEHESKLAAEGVTVREHRVVTQPTSSSD